MSDFVDKFTTEAESNKKKLVSDYELKLADERRKGEEIRQKASLEKSEIDIKY
jgi:hypothetical protein